MKNNKSKPIFFAIGIVFAILLCSFLWFFAFVFIVDARPLHKHMLVHVKHGETLNQLSRQVAHLGLVPHPIFFKYWTEMSDAQYYLQSGYYQMTPQMSIHGLLKKIDHGWNQHFKLVVIPGETVNDLQQQVKQTGTGLYIRAQPNIEGLLLPNTYFYYDNHSLHAVIGEAHQQMQVYLNKLWQKRDKKLIYLNQYKVLIMASILEKEASSYQDQRHIAGVFINRMLKGMYLDSDATVRYAVHAKPGQPLTHKDFKSTSFYNTYRYKYLPPSPICFVSKQAIKAALHPLKTNDLYYLTKKNGQTIFSPKPIHLKKVSKAA